jgi:hypothetical protein
MACGGDDDGGPSGPTPAIAIAVAPTTLTAAPGGTQTATVTLTRTNFTGAVNLAVEGAPDGVTASFAPASLSGATNTSTLTVTVGEAVADDSYDLTVRASGEGVTSKTVPVTLTVSTAPAPGFTLAVAPATVSIIQGGTGTATATVTRTNGFAGAVNIAVSGVPQGVTITPDPASIPGNVATSTLNITVPADFTPGTHTITVTGTAEGIADQSTTFTLEVTQQQGGGGNVSVAYCEDDAPIWLAVQDGDGAWTRVNPGENNTFTFNIASGKGGVAAVTQNADDDFDLSVLYGTADEFNAATAGGAAVCNTTPTGTKTVNGTVAGVAEDELVIVALGPATAFVIPGNSDFTIQNVPEGALDLVATRYAAENFQANKIIIRRNVNVPTGGTLDPLDFAGTEAFDPQEASLTINNIGADLASIGVLYLSSSASATLFGGTPIFFEAEASNTSPRPYFGVPADKLGAGDLHFLFASASPEVPEGEDPDRTRSVFEYFTTVADRTVTLGPDLAEPAFPPASVTPYLQPRATLAAQPEYNQFATITFTQDTRSADVSMTAAYAGGAGFDLAVPDLSGAEGFDANWAPKTGVATTWDASAFGGSSLLFFLGGRPTDGTSLLLATRNGDLGTLGARAARASASSATPTARASRTAQMAKMLRMARALQAAQHR